MPLEKVKSVHLPHHASAIHIPQAKIAKEKALTPAQSTSKYLYFFYFACIHAYLHTYKQTNEQTSKQANKLANK